MNDRSMKNLKLHRPSADNEVVVIDEQTMLLRRAEEFLVSHIKHRNFIDETIHPWRRDARQVILHSFRVLAYAKQIMEAQGDRLAEREMLLIQLAAILHDIGKFYRKEKHAQMSYEVVQKWLFDTTQLDTEEKIRLLQLIAGHSDKEAEDNDLCSIVLKDADTLDEIGAISIFMTSNWLDKTSPFFFHELSARLEEFELAFCDTNYNRLKTVCGKEIMEEKRRFIESFIKQLNMELSGTEEFYELMGEI